MGDDKERIERLRKDLFLATANRGLVYTAVLKELREEFGEERASEIFKRAIYNHGKNVAQMFDVPDTLAEFKEWLLDFFPDGGAMNEPEVDRTPERRLEYIGGRSKKFWIVWTEGVVMRCRWGRIGTKGQSKEWVYGSVAAARSMASRKANEKLDKGYREVLLPEVFSVPAMPAKPKRKAKPKPKKPKTLPAGFLRPRKVKLKKRGER